MIGDPSLFLDFLDIEPQYSKLELKRKFRTYRENHPYARKFTTMAYRGDKMLALYSDTVAWELFGGDNHNITQLVLADWNSNESWTELALLYKFEQHLIWIPKFVQQSIYKRDFGKVKKHDKFWADLWEAWWAALFLEREMWDDNIDDLLSFLRRLIFLKYRPLVEHYSTICFLDKIVHSNVPYFQVTDINAQDKRITKCLRPKSYNNNELIPYGHLTTFSVPVIPVPDSDLSSLSNACSASVFSVTEMTAISRPLNYVRKGFRGTNHSIYTFFSANNQSYQNDCRR